MCLGRDREKDALVSSNKVVILINGATIVFSDNKVYATKKME